MKVLHDKSIKPHKKIYPEIIEIRPFYTVQTSDGPVNYAVMDDIAEIYRTSVVNIKNQIDGANVKKLNGLEISKEKNPYVIMYKDIIYECSTLKDIKEITGISVTKIHNLIKKYLLEK